MILTKIFERCFTLPWSGCWIFMGGLNKDGYGMIWHEGRMQYVHHLTHDAVKGRPRPGLERDHKCKTRCCVNPDHLEAVTPVENAARGDWHKFCAVMPEKGWVCDAPLVGNEFELV